MLLQTMKQALQVQDCQIKVIQEIIKEICSERDFPGNECGKGNLGADANIHGSCPIINPSLKLSGPCFELGNS